MSVQLEETIVNLKARCFDAEEHIRGLQTNYERCSNAIADIATVVGVDTTDGKLDVDELTRVISEKFAEDPK